MKNILYILSLVILFGCKDHGSDSDTIKVVTTTNIIADLVLEIGGDKVFLQSLMGPGVDPHLYKASEGDVSRLFNADIVFITACTSKES